MSTVEYRSPDISCLPGIIKLVEGTPKLDTNSRYAYALWCTDFSENSAVAIKDGKVIAFLTGYRNPNAPEKYFLWQTATAPRHGVPNLGLNVIKFAVEREISKGAKVIEASVDEDNKPITMLMASLCKMFGGSLTKRCLFDGGVLSDDHQDHHPETLYSIAIN